MTRLIASLLLLPIALVPAFAQQITEEQRQACFGDYQSFCAGVIPGGGRIIACLRQNQDKISAQCRTVLQATEQQH
jgi:hypothetical protein